MCLVNCVTQISQVNNCIIETIYKNMICSLIYRHNIIKRLVSVCLFQVNKLCYNKGEEEKGKSVKA